MLFHVSEELAIQLFVPRASPGLARPAVWAIDARHLRNYLLPRDCPRVTFARGPRTDPLDIHRFLGAASAVVAIEARWAERARLTRLACYSLPPDSFHLHDRAAGYYVSHQPVRPAAVELIADPVDRLSARNVELRLLPNLWELHDAIAASTLEFSMIRMRNALPPAAPSP